jgi:hypothetical protein
MDIGITLFEVLLAGNFSIQFTIGEQDLSAFSYHAFRVE